MNRNVINGLLVAALGTLLVYVLGTVTNTFYKYDSFLQSTDFWVGAAFMCFWGLLTYLRVPQNAVASLDSRRERISAEIEEARRLREEAQKTLANYERRTRSADEEAAEIVARAKRDSEAMAAEAKEKLAETMERRTKAATDRIAQAEAQAVADVRRAAAKAATEAAEILLRERMEGGAGSQQIDAAIGTVRERLN